METTEFDGTIAELLSIGDGLKLFEREKNEYEVRVEKLESMNRKLFEQIEEMTKQQIDRNEKYTTLNTKYIRRMKELNQFKEKCNEKDIRIDQLEKQIQLLTKENEDNQIQLAEQAELKKLLAERETEITRFTEQLENLSKDTKQRISKLKTDFKIMYEKQSTVFIQKIALLKEEQGRNMARLYQHEL